MADDLVKRLREENLRLKANLNEAYENLSHGLTEIFGLNDRIEALEAALREIESGDYCKRYGLCHCPDHARAALGEKKDD